MFLANAALKAQLDPLRRENRFRPGGYLWVPGDQLEKALRPLDVAKRDFGDSAQEESILKSEADNLLGASELRSGRETPNDPRAPAAKVGLLLQQSAVRLDDFIAGFIRKENEALDMCKKLYYQYGPDMIKFSAEQNSRPVEVDIERSKFNLEKIHLQLAITSLVDNPDYLRQKWEEFYVKYSAEPMLGAIPEVRHKVLSQIVLNTPEANGLGILPPLEAVNEAVQSQAAQALGVVLNPPKKSGENPTMAAALNGNINGAGGGA